jgi:hypothetical protein
VGAGSLWAMPGTVLAVTVDELQRRLADAPPSTSDDVGITTFDGRHLRTKDEILAFLAEVDEGRGCADLDADAD